MSLASEELKIITADIYYYNNDKGTEGNILRVSNMPYPGYMPIITSVMPFTTSVLATGVNHGWGGITLANVEGGLDYIVCDRDNSYIFNKRKLVLKVYVGGSSTPEVTHSGLILDMTSDSETSIVLRYTDPMAELDQPLVTINPAGNASNTSELDRYKPLTINQLYNTFRSLSDGIPADNPRFSERDTVVPLAIGDVFNYSPLSLDFLKTDNADLIYLLYPPDLGFSAQVFNVKDGGVILTDWELDGPYLTLKHPIFMGLTVDARIGPYTVKDVLSTVINQFPNFGTYTRSATFDPGTPELGMKGNVSIGYVGTCGDSIATLVNSVCQSVSVGLYCKSPTQFEVYRFQNPPDLVAESPEDLDPLANYNIFYSGEPFGDSQMDLRLRTYRYIDKDDSGSAGFEGVDTLNIHIDTANGYPGYVFDHYSRSTWSWNNMDGSGPNGAIYANPEVFSGKFTLDFFVDLTRLPDILGTNWVPILEFIGYNFSSTRSHYIYTTNSVYNAPGASYSVWNSNYDMYEYHRLDTEAMVGDLCIGVHYINSAHYLAIKTGLTTWIEPINIGPEKHYMAVEFNGTSYTVYLNGTRVATNILTRVGNLAHRNVMIGAAYAPDIYKEELKEVGSINDSTYIDIRLRETDASTNVALAKIFSNHPSLAKFSSIRITNETRYNSVASITPPETMVVGASKTLAATISYADVVKGTFKVSKVNVPQKASVYLGYARNWTPGATLAGQFTEFPSWKEALSKEQYEIYKSNERLVTKFKFTPVSAKNLESTLLITTVDAQLEAEGRLSRYIRRTMEVVMQVHPDLAILKIGDYVKIIHHRYGIDPEKGRFGVIIGKSTDYVNNTHSIAVLI